jgi:hypothetical protein
MEGGLMPEAVNDIGGLPFSGPDDGMLLEEVTFLKNARR